MFLAVLDGELAVPCDPQTATAGLNSRLRSRAFWSIWRQVVLKSGSRAAEACEPRQDRKIATVSGNFRVSRGSLGGAN